MDPRPVLTVACLLILAAYALMIDLKGISTDEGIRLAIINGGQPFSLNAPAAPPTWAMVLKTGSPYAYQPLYYLMQNTLMRVAQSQNVVFFRLVNIAFLWVCLQGLLALSKTWRLGPRLFLLGVFSFNAYLFMHVLQIREYIVGVAFYIWSTWLVLGLNERKLGRAWADVCVFVSYGVLLTLGFFLQSWVVFPAIGQFLFLILRRRDHPWRYYGHLALSYIVVLSAALPYLQSHRQRVAVGRWGEQGTVLWPQLSNGFHLVLSGHEAGHSPYTEFLFWFWLAVIAGAAGLLFSRKTDAATAVPKGEFKRQGWLMLLCSGVALAFQVGYYYKVENLSLWPRYFVVHYFFLTWLIALSFNYLYELGAVGGGSAIWRRSLQIAAGAIAAVALASGVYQTASYYDFPFLDTGFSRESNWHTIATEMARVVEPGDVVVTYDFVTRSTLTFTRPITNPVIPLSDLETSDLRSVPRLVYLESAYAASQRRDLAARMAKLGFGVMQEIGIPSTNGSTMISDWRLLTFQRQ